MIPRGPISLWWYSPRRLVKQRNSDSPDWHSLENPNSSCQAVLTRSQVAASVLLSRVHCSCVSWTHPAHSELWGLSTSFVWNVSQREIPKLLPSGRFYSCPKLKEAGDPREVLGFHSSCGLAENCPWHSRCLTTNEKQTYKSSCQTLDHDHNGCYWKQCQLSLDLLRRPPVKQFLCYPPPSKPSPKPPREVRKGSFMPDEETKAWLLQHICTSQGSSWRFHYISIMEWSSTA